MANAVVPRWHGDTYQSRFFWIHAASLLDPLKPEVVEVTFEADGPKAFDDVVVRYDPGRPRASGPGRITVDYHQIKFHTDGSGRFGFKDLIDPKFIGATSISILERLKSAKAQAGDGAAFHLITTDHTLDGDQLGELISRNDSSLRLEKLKEGKTDNSRMGEVRKLWREHLSLGSDEELYDLLDGFHITEAYGTLERLRHEVSMKFRLVGLVGAEDETAFIYDEAAKQLVIKKVNRFDRDGFRQWCETESWFLPKSVKARPSVAIQSYPPRPSPTYMRDASPENTLDLTSRFNGRLLATDTSWPDLESLITDFLKSMLAKEPLMRLFLEAHAPIATLAGARLGFKSGADVEVVQRGQNNPGIIWSATDGAGGPEPTIEAKFIGEGKDVAVAIGLTHDTAGDVRGYVANNLTDVGTLLRVTPANGPGQDAIRGGEHAVTMAGAIAKAVIAARTPGSTVHLFVAGPNAFAFFLGQQAEAMGKCIPYEFDFGGRTDGTYRPTFTI